MPEPINRVVRRDHTATVVVTVHAPTADSATTWAGTIASLVRAEHGDHMRLDIRRDPSAPADRAALRDRIAAALLARIKQATVSKLRPYDGLTSLLAANEYDLADAVLAVLPPAADRAAVLRELADRAEEWDGHITKQELRRLADEAQQGGVQSWAAASPPTS